MQNFLPFQTMLSREPLQVTRIRDYINPGSFIPHRHQFFMLLWITNGSGAHVVDFESLELQPNRVFPVAEGQVHQMVTPAQDGWMLTFKSNIFYAIGEGAGGIDPTEIFDNAFIDLSDTETTNFTWIWNLLQRTAESNATDPMLINQLRILLGCLLHCRQQCCRNKPQAGNHSILQQLKKLINTHFQQQPHAAWYASALNIPLWKLNTWCRESLGNNVSGLLTERVVLEAKALLATTSLSVKEITYELGLEDPSNFAKVFKRHTGAAPLDYRESHRPVLRNYPFSS